MPDKSTKDKHTAGPWVNWRMDPENVISEHRRDDGSFPIIATVRGANKDANARLIAAAPELLEALKAKLAARVHSERVAADALARAAIAKAEGR